MSDDNTKKEEKSEDVGSKADFAKSYVKPKEEKTEEIQKPIEEAGESEVVSEVDKVIEENTQNIEIKPDTSESVVDPKSDSLPFREGQGGVDLAKIEIEKNGNLSTPSINSGQDSLEAGKTIEKKGDIVTITEVMRTAQSENPTAQMAGNEPFSQKRQENLLKANEKRYDKKFKGLEKILQLLTKQSKIANDEVEKLLRVSDATATRYLDILEKEGKIKQIGKTGKGVYYTKL